MTMKIGMLTSADDRCGIARYSRDLCAGFGSTVKVDVVPVRSGREPWPPYIAQSSERLNRSDVVHIQHEYSFWGSILPGKNGYFRQMRSIKRPKVITAHTLDSAAAMLVVTESGGIAGVLKRMLGYVPSYQISVECGVFDLGDRIIVHDNPCKRILTGRGISEKNIRVIPMGVPEPIAVEGLGDSFREKNSLFGKTLIVIFGFVRPGRGYEAALDILADLDRDTVLVIAGGAQNPEQDWYLAELYESIRSRNLRERVLVTGYLSDADVAGVMQASDVVLCSQESGTGSYSVQVALGYGKPIIASDLPCFKDMETSFGCLTTYRNGSRQVLASKLELLLGNPEAMRKLSVAASNYAGTHTWQKIADMTLGVYRELSAG